MSFKVKYFELASAFSDGSKQLFEKNGNINNLQRKINGIAIYNFTYNYHYIF